MTDHSKLSIDVVAGAIRRADGRILICLRPRHLDHGGLWEFPGGKREAGESRTGALERELYEELGIAIRTAAPLLRVSHDYSTKRVNLDVWEISDWVGTATGREGQQLRWVRPSELRRFEFPAANRTVVTAVNLPRMMIVERKPPATSSRYLDALEACMKAGVRLYVLTPPSTDAARFAEQVQECCARYDPIVLFAGNTGAGFGTSWNSETYGLHLHNAALRATGERPSDPGALFSASCVSLDDLLRAERIGADMVVIPHEDPGPAESSPPNRLTELVGLTRLPAYVSGCLHELDPDRMVAMGFQGVALEDGLSSGPPAGFAAYLKTLSNAGRVTVNPSP